MSRPRQFSLRQLLLLVTLLAISLGLIVGSWRWTNYMVLYVERDYWRRAMSEQGREPPAEYAELLFTSQELEQLRKQADEARRTDKPQPNP